MVYHASLVAQTVKNLPAIWETWVQSLGWEDPLGEGMATHSSILAWRIPMDRGAWWATVLGVAKSRTGLSGCVHMHVVYHTVLIEFPVLYSRALFMIKFFQVAFKYVIIINRISIMSAKC